MESQMNPHIKYSASGAGGAGGAGGADGTNTRLKRRISFSDCTKTHDGLRKNSKNFESVIAGYFVSKTITNQEGINAILKTKSEFEIVLKMFEDLINRIGKKNATNVPVLPQGGGLALKISVQHIRYIRILQEFVQKAYDKFLETYVPVRVDIIMEDKSVCIIENDSDKAFDLYRSLFA